MKKVWGLLVICYSLTYGIEYRFNKIAQIPCGAPITNRITLLIGDTDHNGLNELIFTNNTLEDREYPYRFEIWEYKGENSYKRVYEEEPLQPDSSIKSFEPWVLGEDIDKDGLADMIGEYNYIGPPTAGGSSTKVVMRESPDYHSYPTEVVWEKKCIDCFDPNHRWTAIPIIVDMDKDGRNEYIFRGYCVKYFFVAKCTGDNEIELVDSSEIVDGWSYFYTSGDFDMDGRYELAGEGGPGVKVYENTNGYKFEGTWGDTFHLVGGFDVFSSKDSDGDGRPEFFIGYYWSMGNTFWLYRWETDGDNSYKRMLIDSVWVDTWLPGRASACGDVDGDGIDEIVWSIGKKVFIYKAISDDRYEKVWEWVIPNKNSWNGPRVGIKVYDMNKNGYAEIIASVQSDIEKVTKIFEIDTTCLGIPSHPPVSKFLNSPTLSISPNPFKEVVGIKYQVAKEGPVSLLIYDSQGRLVRTLIKEQNQKPGVYRIKWDGRDDKGRELPIGIYFCRIEAQNFTRLCKVILLR